MLAGKKRKILKRFFSFQWNFWLILKYEAEENEGPQIINIHFFNSTLTKDTTQRIETVHLCLIYCSYRSRTLVVHVDIYLLLLFVLYRNEKNVYMYIYIYILRSGEKESQRRNTTHSFSRSFACLLRRMKKKSKNTHKYTEEKKEKCYGETLLAMITRPTNGCALARKKNEIRENVNLTTKIVAD